MENSEKKTAERGEKQSNEEAKSTDIISLPSKSERAKTTIGWQILKRSALLGPAEAVPAALSPAICCTAAASPSPRRPYDSSTRPDPPVRLRLFRFPCWFALRPISLRFTAPALSLSPLFFSARSPTPDPSPVLCVKRRYLPPIILCSLVTCASIDLRYFLLVIALLRQTRRTSSCPLRYAT